LNASFNCDDSASLKLLETVAALSLRAAIAGPSVGPVLRPALNAPTKRFTLSIASLLELASDSQEERMALVVRDCCRWDSRTLDVADDADTDADTDCRYAGATLVSGVAVPLVTVVHPTMPISAAATHPIASTPRFETSPPCVREMARPLLSTASDVTGSGFPKPPTHRLRVGFETGGEPFASESVAVTRPRRRYGTMVTNTHAENPADNRSGS
jgi:hypothetical protein